MSAFLVSFFIHRRVPVNLIQEEKTLMTQEEKQAFLTDLHVGVLALNDGAHGPLAVPIWYDYRPGGELWLLTAPYSRKGKLLAVGTRVSLVAQSEDPPYKYVSIEGPITSITAADEDDLLAMAVRYLGSEEGGQYADNNKVTGTGEVIVRVMPEHWLAADYSKS